MSFISQINKSSIAAAKLAQAFELAIAGDATGTVSMDGSQNATLTVTLANTADARTNLGLGTAAVLNTGVAAGNIPVLDENGKLNANIIPQVAITDVYVNDAISGTTEAEAQTALETYATGLTSQVGDVIVYTMSWTSPEAGSSSGTLIKKADGQTFGDSWVSLSTPTQAQLETLTATVNAHIGSNGVSAHALADGTNAGFMPALASDASKVLDGEGTWTAHIGLGGDVHATVSTTAAGFAPALPTENATAKVLDGEGAWVEHIGLGGDAHAVADTTKAGFMPALPTEEAAGKFLSGTGQWTEVSTITTVATTGATTGAFTKIGDHWGVAMSATEVVTAGIVAYGTGLTVGKKVYVNDTDGTVVYDLDGLTGTYAHVGYVVSSTSIEVAPAQTVYTLIA